MIHRPQSGTGAGSERSEYPSRLAVNIYLLIGVALLVFSSRIGTTTLERYGIGIVVEFTLAALALLFMRVEHLEIATTARLRRPELREVGLAILTVPGLWIVGVILNLLASLLLGYTTPTTPSQYPRTALEAVALALTTVVAAPLCEEVMFRGYVQRAYERKNVWAGILTGGVVFALYHLRFQGAPALIPVALVLSLLAWRTESIVPGIALHAAYNAIATVLMVTLSFLPMPVTGALTGSLVCLALILTPVSLAALWLLWRGSSPSPKQSTIEPRAWQRWAWILPGLALVAVYGYAAATEVVIGAFPELASIGPLQLEEAPVDWDGTVSWHYDIQNALGENLGEADCTRNRTDQYITLVCEADSEEYDITSDFPGLEIDMEDMPVDLWGAARMLRTEPRSWSFSAGWLRNSLELSTLDAYERIPELGVVQLLYRLEDGQASLATGPDGDEITLNKAKTGITLLPYEWAWRLGSIPFELAYAADANIVQLDPEGQAQLYPALVNVAGGEPTWTPAGTYIAWKVIVSWEDADGQEQQQTAWYDSNAPHTLVGFDDGTVTYALRSLETENKKTE